MGRSISWQKSSHSGGGEDNSCIEVGGEAGDLAIRESADPKIVIKISSRQFLALALRIKRRNGFS
ncbi:DUF397 domain-containing protein [Streptomyces sp. NPDC052396]|uniref:DUF397 domain-containing protein n=1 Tax=Streptomyces sp. NPDC052396 TaxID=3365689 RepID=UPI0037D1F957